MKRIVVVGLLLMTLSLGMALLVAFTNQGESYPPNTTTTTIDAEYARCMAIETHKAVLDYRDLETARYLANVACNGGKVEIPSLPMEER